ncbi:LTA synthase family protein [Oleiharenicola lentus]|uniref:LTA synthase family protein n=1 Tax=Oleiharenicola lentus TaxID=2508720 RepID=UPI003F66AB8F
MNSFSSFLSSVRARAEKSLARRHGLLVVFFAAFAVVALCTRLGLLAASAREASWNASLLASFGWGLVYDLGAAAFAGAPLAVLLTVLPAGFFEKRWARVSAYVAGFVMLYALVFGAVAEWFFWEEFGARFNFIAVDYLVYTTEVIGNIRESYNLPLILAVVAAVAGLWLWALHLCGAFALTLRAQPETARRRYASGALWLAGMLAFGLVLREEQLPAFRNNYNRELGKDGLWSLFAAFQNNVLDYAQFYKTMPIDDAFARLTHELTEDDSVPVKAAGYDTLRLVRGQGVEQHLNVIQITVESLSADFLGIFNHASNLTPNLTEIAAKSLVFDNFYATGTRTDRGMEALTLSLPPTPGRSMIKRPRNEGMFTLGSLFRAKGYDTAFIYGGFGYFDNMNYFFGNNGYRVIDRNSVAKNDVSFANVWGACDEDLYRWTMREADASSTAGKPFHYFVMTTSNHRPYTFPEGKIDLASKTSGRAGAVKYTDYAIGQFLRDASTKPWFKNTVFVIVADHCASSAGRTELPVQNYHIPLIIYAPGGHIAPGHIKTLTSQIDYAPTLLGMLNWSYPSRFFGHDVRRIPEDDAHALVGNYQKLGHLEKGEMAVLRPQQGSATYHYDAKAALLTPVADSAYAVSEAICYYQTASYLYQHGLYRALPADEFARLTALANTPDHKSAVAVNK